MTTLSSRPFSVPPHISAEHVFAWWTTTGFVTWLEPGAAVSLEDAEHISRALSIEETRRQFGDNFPLVIVHDFRNCRRFLPGSRDHFVKWALGFKPLTIQRVHVATDARMATLSKMAVTTGMLALRMAAFPVVHDDNVESTLKTLIPASPEKGLSRPLSPPSSNRAGASS